jgi:hypothetical protein
LATSLNSCYGVLHARGGHFWGCDAAFSYIGVYTCIGHQISARIAIRRHCGIRGYNIRDAASALGQIT